MTDHGTLSIAPPPATFAVTSLVYGSARNHGAYAIAAPPRTFVLSGYSIAGTAECPDCPDCPELPNGVIWSPGGRFGQERP